MFSSSFLGGTKYFSCTSAISSSNKRISVCTLSEVLTSFNLFRKYNSAILAQLLQLCAELLRLIRRLYDRELLVVLSQNLWEASMRRSVQRIRRTYTACNRDKVICGLHLDVKHKDKRADVSTDFIWHDERRQSGREAIER